MNKNRLIVSAVLALATLMPVVVQAQSNLPPVTKVTFYVVTLPSWVASNVSFVEGYIPEPTVADQEAGRVLRLGGVSSDTGNPIGMIAYGRPDRPWVMPFSSGYVSSSLQFKTCADGSDTIVDSFSDLFTTYLVADWAVKPGLIITSSNDDKNGVGTGDYATMSYKDVLSFPKYSFTTVRLPDSADNKMSLAKSCMSDISRPGLGQLASLLLGWKDNQPRGVYILNGRNYDISLEIPQCGTGGAEWLNDMGSLTVLMLTDQMLTGPSWQQTTVVEDDPQQESSSIYRIIWNQYVKRVKLPIVYKP